MNEFVISGRPPKVGGEGPIPVAIVSGGSSGGLTDAELRATPVPVSVSGVATAAKQDTGNTSLATLAGAVSGTEVQVDVLTMPTTTVQATNLDIRDLTFASDKVDISGSTNVGVTGTFWQATQPVSLTSTTITGTVAVTQSGTWDEVGINDSGNSITVDAPVATPVFVRLSDGASAISTLPVSLASVPTHAVTQSGTWTLGANSGVDIGDVTINNLTSTPVFIQHNTTAVANGRTTVTTAGTRVALAASTACKWVIITAETDNTGLIVVGSASGVIAALATRQGTPLYAGDSVTIHTDNLADIGLDSTVNGDGVTYTYGT